LSPAVRSTNALGHVLPLISRVLQSPVPVVLSALYPRPASWGQEPLTLLLEAVQDLIALLCRGWICFEIAVRMISDKPMVELIDPHRKATELFQSGGLQQDFFAGMQTFDPQDKLLIQHAIRRLFARGDSDRDGADPESNFNRGVGDFVRLTGGKMRVGDLFVQAQKGESGCFQVRHAFFAVAVACWFLETSYLGIYLRVNDNGIVFVLRQSRFWWCFVSRLQAAGARLTALCVRDLSKFWTSAGNCQKSSMTKANLLTASSFVSVNWKQFNRSTATSTRMWPRV